MSYLTQFARREVGHQKYENLKSKFFGAGIASAINKMPQNGGEAPHASIEHRIAFTDWQPLAVGAAVLLFSYYLLKQA